ncbi:hypothetical protein PSW70_23955, partial [Shigella flexneri]|nr:hypothetical protein [Shigella flexneri]
MSKLAALPKNAAFYLWGNPSRPVVAELGDDSGW